MTRTASTLFTLVAIFALCGFALCNSASAESPKGIILVLIDDIGYGDIDVLTPSDLETPSLDDLYRESISLTDFHVGTTCAPTRASLMTGRYVNAGGVWHTIAGRELLREDEQTMAEVFQANGWATGIFGKWHLGEGYPFAPRFRGFDVSIIHGGGGVGQGPDYWDNDYYTGVDFQGNPTQADTYFVNGKPTEADKFCTDYWFDRSMEFIKQNADEGKPFFCYLPTNAAHGPFNAPHGEKKGFDGLIENVDDNMARLDKFLTAEGIKDDVLLIFTCDNGTAGKRLGGLKGKKVATMRAATTFPVLFAGKNGGMAGSAEGRRDINSLTAAMDFLPTFIDMCDLKQPAGGHPLHGISLKESLLNAESKPQPRTLIVDTQRSDSLQLKKSYCVMQDVVEGGVIQQKWRAVGNKEKVPALYNFLTDRGSKNDLASGNEAIIKPMMDQYTKWFDEISKNCEPYPAFVVNHEKEAELTLHAHSWIGTGGSPWHQNHVRKAGKGTGVHSIRFDHPGKYRVELRRWPREDGGAIGGKCKTGECKTITPLSARLSIKGVGHFYSDVDLESPSVSFDVSIRDVDPTKMTTAFLDADGNVICGAYCTYIKAIK